MFPTDLIVTIKYLLTYPILLALKVITSKRWLIMTFLPRILTRSTYI